MKITELGYFVSALLLAETGLLHAAPINKNTARMQAMDKITGRVSVINVPVGGGVDFGSLSIVVRSCKTRPAEETPDNFAFIDVADTTLKGEQLNIFKGWMISSSPATNAVEHPIYDVWLLQCLDSEVKNDQLWSEQKLAERDNLPMQPRPAVVQMAEQTETATKETSSETASRKITKPISEMTYTPSDDEQFEPEDITNEDNLEFSFDEDDDMSEIQNELDRIKSELGITTIKSLPEISETTTE